MTKEFAPNLLRPLVTIALPASSDSARHQPRRQDRKRDLEGREDLHYRRRDGFDEASIGGVLGSMAAPGDLWSLTRGTLDGLIFSNHEPGVS